MSEKKTALWKDAGLAPLPPRSLYGRAEPVTKPAVVVTKPIEAEKPKGGRPRKGDEVMTPADRMRKMRAAKRETA